MLYDNSDLKKVNINKTIRSLLLITIFFSCTTTHYKNIDLSEGLDYKDAYTIVGPKNFIKDFLPRNSDGTLNAVIEIPAGTNEKWEVKEPDGILKFDFKDNKPRYIKYLSYPVNYGMIPGTVGGDADPLDVIVIGNSVPRGSVLKVKLLGVLKLTDTGETDDKLIAIQTDYAISSVNSLEELENDYPGITEIIELWFTNYKGKGKMVSGGYAGITDASDILNKAIDSFNKLENK